MAGAGEVLSHPQGRVTWEKRGSSTTLSSLQQARNESAPLADRGGNTRHSPVISGSSIQRPSFVAVIRDPEKLSVFTTSSLKQGYLAQNIPQRRTLPLEKIGICGCPGLQRPECSHRQAPIPCLPSSLRSFSQ